MIGFFTDEIEYEYPHPPISIHILIFVEDAIRYAWNILAQHPPPRFDLQTASEKMITLALLNVLEKLRQANVIDGFNSINFETVIREGNLTNYNGKHPDKEPDLVFRLCEIREGTQKLQDGVITECKPIDGNHPVGSSYCKAGLIRFVNGDYAWAMQSGLMIGYVSGNYTIYPKLSDALQKDHRVYNTKKMPYICQQSKRLKKEPTVYVTIHDRIWKYPSTGKKAQTIEIRHLWLKVKD